MRVLQFFFLFLLTCNTSAIGMEWKRGVITHDAWMDQGGYHVAVDNTIYLFIQTATIHVEKNDYEIPDRLTYMTKGSKVRILKEGFRIYALEIEWRKLP